MECEDIKQANIQVAAVVFTSNMKAGAGTMVLFGFGKNPESAPKCVISALMRFGGGKATGTGLPSGILTQGFSKVDCVKV